MPKKFLSHQTEFDPGNILRILIIIIMFWILARPVKFIGENIYLFFGSFANSTYQGIANSKSSAERLIQSERTANMQEKIISQLKIKNNILENQNKELSDLKELNNLQKNIQYKTVDAAVIGRSPDNWHKQIIINKGKNYGIKIGDTVLTRKGIVGQIIELNSGTSIVELISDPSFKLGCKLKKNNINGILTGKTNTIALLEFIPIGTKVNIGDVVVASGITSGNLPPAYPAGHIVGQVIKISKKKSKSSDLYIEVKLSEKLNKLSNVLIFSP